MYAKLSFDISTTAQEALVDIVDALTGETNLNNLSAKVVIGSSEIVDTYGLFWELWDDVSADEKILRAPITDDPTRYKYMRLATEATSNDGMSEGIYMESYRDWNNVAHTGTVNNRRTAGSQNVQSTSDTQKCWVFACNPTTISCEVYFTASQAHFAVMARMSSNVQSGVSMITEHTRVSPWDTVANAYDPIFYVVSPITEDVGVNTGADDRICFNLPVCPNAAGGDLDINVTGDEHNFAALTTSVGTFGNTQISQGGLQGVDQVLIPSAVLDENKIARRPMIGFGGSWSKVGNYGGSITDFNGMFLTDPTGTHGDVINVQGIDFVEWTLADGKAFRPEGNGWAHFLVPKL